MIQPHPIPQELRAQIDRITGASRRAIAAPLALGIPSIDCLLPSNGLARGAIHEIIGDLGATTAFLIALVARQIDVKQVLWITLEPTIYPQGLLQLGLDHRKLTVVSARRADDRLWAMEEGLRELSYGAVVAEVETADLTETRRLQLAAEKSGSIGFLIRRDQQPSAALTRWRIESARSDGYRPCWRVNLERCRGAEAGFSWDVEWNYATLSFRLVAALADGSLAAAE